MQRQNVLGLVVISLVLGCLAVPVTAMNVLLDTDDFWAPSKTVEFVPDEAGVSSRFVSSAHETNNALTAMSDLVVSSTSATVGATELHLLGVASDVAKEPDLFSVVWVPGSATWFGPIWRLELRIGNLSIANLNTDTVLLSNANPKVGSQYRTYVGYDSDDGLLSVLVWNETEGKQVYSGEHEVGAYSGPLYAAAGVHGEDPGDALLAVNGLFVAPSYVPVGGQWVVGEKGQSGRFVSSREFGAHESVHMSIPVSSSKYGQFRVYAERIPGAPELLGESLEHPGYELTPDKLGYGSQILRLEYVDNEGTVLLRGERRINIGRAYARIGELKVNAEEQAIAGAIHIGTDGPKATADIEIEATFRRKQWDNTNRRYVTTTVRDVRLPVTQHVIDDEETIMQFALPFPDPDSPGLWEIQVKSNVDLDTQIAFREPSDKSRLFTTHAPAQNLDSLPFRVVMMPDTQIYASDFPDIFVRQSEWIAAYADPLNIGAVIHVGDIVDNNDVRQWTNADRGLHVLDGVVPYVLAVGNHDVRVHFSPEQSLFDREGALMMDYFTIDNAKENSNMAGTFINDRLENSYSLFSFGGEQYLVMAFEWGPRDEVLEWANDVLAAHPDHKVIFTTHAFTAPDGGWVTPDRYPIALPKSGDFVPEPSTVNSAADIWEKVIDNHDNVILVLSGHMGGHSGIPHNVHVGKQGNTVVEIFANYQMEENGGNGWFVLLTFTSDEKLLVEAFSPYLCEHRFDFGRFWQNYEIDLRTRMSRPRNSGLIGTCDLL